MSHVSASYKKKDGTLSVSQDLRQLTWTPSEPQGAPPQVKISMQAITNIQKSTATSKNVSVRVVMETENYTFTFTSPTNAREEQTVVTDLVTKATTRKEPPKPATGSATPGLDAEKTSSAAMAIAQAISGRGKADDDARDDSELLKDTDLQKSFLKDNPHMREKLAQALKNKPEKVTVGQLTNQFWATRVKLLRDHAAVKAQNPGVNNVLSEIRETQDEEGKAKLKFNQRQIQLMLEQHPLIRRAYDECTPEMSEGDFWSRFWRSRLKKKLHGTKITELDSVDAKLDKYLTYTDTTNQDREIHHVPNYLDLEGNEQNHSQKKGNAPDITMRPEFHEKAPVLRILNSMSEKLMADVTPSDAVSHAPVGMDEETYKEVRLRDLQNESIDNRITLSTKSQQWYRSTDDGAARSEEAKIYAKQDPQIVLSLFRNDARGLKGSGKTKTGLDLKNAIGVRDDSSSDEENTRTPKRRRIGCRSGRGEATKQLVDAFRSRAQNVENSLALPRPVSRLSESTYDDLLTTHNTTVEFLHYFWTVLLSGNPERAGEVEQLIGSLDRSIDRIVQRQKEAQKERETEVERSKMEDEVYFKRTGGKKRRTTVPALPGGEEAVKALMAPTKRAIEAARTAYATALAEEKQALPHLDAAATTAS